MLRGVVPWWLILKPKCRSTRPKPPSARSGLGRRRTGLSGPSMRCLLITMARSQQTSGKSSQSASPRSWRSRDRLEGPLRMPGPSPCEQPGAGDLRDRARQALVMSVKTGGRANSGHRDRGAFVHRCVPLLRLSRGRTTNPIASTVTHAGICKVKRYAFIARPSTPNVFNVGTIVERWPIWPSKAWKWGFWDYCTQPTLGVNLRQGSGRPSEPFIRWMSCNRTALLPIFCWPPHGGLFRFRCFEAPRAGRD